jgi:hypothetical protein
MGRGERALVRLTPKQLNVLRRIVESGSDGINYKVLKRETGLGDPSLTSDLRKLQKLGYARRDQDRKYRANELTPRRMYLSEIANFMLSKDNVITPMMFGAAIVSENSAPFMSEEKRLFSDDKKVKKEIREAVNKLQHILLDNIQKYLYDLLSEADKKFFGRYQRDLVEYARSFVSRHEVIFDEGGHTFEEAESLIKEFRDLEPNLTAIEELRRRLTDVKRKSRNKQILRKIRGGIGKSVLVVPISGFDMQWVDSIQIREAIGKGLDDESYDWLAWQLGHFRIGLKR